MPAPPSGANPSGASTMTNSVTKAQVVTTTKAVHATFSAPISTPVQSSSHNCHKNSSHLSTSSLSGTCDSTKSQKTHEEHKTNVVVSMSSNTNGEGGARKLSCTTTSPPPVNVMKSGVHCKLMMYCIIRK